MATYTSQLGRDSLFYEGASATNLIEFRGDKNIDDSRDEIDDTTDAYLSTNDYTQAMAGPRTVRLSGNLIKPANGETCTSFSNLSTAYTNNSTVTITIKRYAGDSGTAWTARVLKFSPTFEMNGVEQVAIELRLWPAAGS